MNDKWLNLVCFICLIGSLSVVQWNWWVWLSIYGRPHTYTHTHTHTHILVILFLHFWSQSVRYECVCMCGDVIKVWLWCTVGCLNLKTFLCIGPLQTLTFWLNLVWKNLMWQYSVIWFLSILTSYWAYYIYTFHKWNSLVYYIIFYRLLNFLLWKNLPKVIGHFWLLAILSACFT